MPVASLLAQSGINGHGSLTKEQRDALTIPQIIEAMKKGNARFRSGKMAPRDYLAQKRSSPLVNIPLRCCWDASIPGPLRRSYSTSGIGDAFNARVAGNVANDDMLGSMEFACAVAGAKVVFVLGHTKCGAIKGAIDDVVLGNLTGLLARIKPAIAEPISMAKSRARTTTTSMPSRNERAGRDLGYPPPQPSS